MKQLRNLLQKGMFLMKNTKWFWIIAFVAVIGFSAASCGGSGGGLGNAKWEYIVFSHYTGGGYNEELNKKLNEYGAQGWELVSSSLENGQHTQNHVVILKRKL